MLTVSINKVKYNFPKGIKVIEIMNKINPENKHNIVAAIVDNQIYDLLDTVNKDCHIKFLTISSEIGNRIYRRSLFMIMAKAVYNLFPEAKLSIEHSLSNGIYCEIYKKSPLNQGDLEKIKDKMSEFIKKNISLKRLKLAKNKLKEIYKNQRFDDKINMLEQLNLKEYPVYEIDGYYDYLFYNMVPSTAFLNRFDLHYYYPGFILLFPQREDPKKVPEFNDQPKLARVFYDYEKWGEFIGVEDVNDLNKIISENKHGDLVRVSEALHEKQIASIADTISNDIEKNRVILIAGPSSSGKTTFAQRLAIHLKVNALKPVAISTDNYFLERKDTPRDENGNYDFEALEAIDLKLLNEDLIKLLQGRKTEIPEFDFETGSRKYNGKILQIEEDQPIIIEGIHSLNPHLTEVIPEDSKFEIYISALTQLNLDRHNRIPTTDTRLIRRIIRDNQFRNRTASETIKWWPGVRSGEEKNIFPFQENADLMFNSALLYELAVLKKYALPLLENINPNQSSYYQAQRLIAILQCFKTIEEDDIPGTSIIKEFTGGSVFSS